MIIRDLRYRRMDNIRCGMCGDASLDREPLCPFVPSCMRVACVRACVLGIHSTTVP